MSKINIYIIGIDQEDTNRDLFQLIFAYSTANDLVINLGIECWEVTHKVSTYKRNSIALLDTRSLAPNDPSEMENLSQLEVEKQGEIRQLKMLELMQKLPPNLILLSCPAAVEQCPSFLEAMQAFFNSLTEQLTSIGEIKAIAVLDIAPEGREAMIDKFFPVQNLKYKRENFAVEKVEAIVERLNAEIASCVTELAKTTMSSAKDAYATKNLPPIRYAEHDRFYKPLISSPLASKPAPKALETVTEEDESEFAQDL